MKTETEKAKALWHAPEMMAVRREVKLPAMRSISMRRQRVKSDMKIRGLGRRSLHLQGQRPAATWLFCGFMLRATHDVFPGISIPGSRRQPADTPACLGPAPVRLTRSGARPEAHCR